MIPALLSSRIADEYADEVGCPRGLRAGCGDTQCHPAKRRHSRASSGTLSCMSGVAL